MEWIECKYTYAAVAVAPLPIVAASKNVLIAYAECRRRSFFMDWMVNFLLVRRNFHFPLPKNDNDDGNVARHLTCRQHTSPTHLLLLFSVSHAHKWPYSCREVSGPEQYFMNKRTVNDMTTECDAFNLEVAWIVTRRYDKPSAKMNAFFLSLNGCAWHTSKTQCALASLENLLKCKGCVGPRSLRHSPPLSFSLSFDGWDYDAASKWRDRDGRPRNCLQNQFPFKSKIEYGCVFVLCIHPVDGTTAVQSGTQVICPRDEKRAHGNGIPTPASRPQSTIL